jgi:hypothetical protein
MSATKIRVDMRLMTPRLMADAGELLGMSLMDAMQGPKQPLAIAAIAAIQNPELSFDQLADTPLTEFDLVNEDTDPKALGANNGGAPQPSPVSGA